MNYRKSLNLFISCLINFIVFLIPVLFYQPSFDPFGPIQLMIARIFIPLLFVAVFMKGIIDGQILLKKSLLLFPLAGYLVICAVSIIFSLNPEISFKYFIEMFIFISGGWLIYSVSGVKEVKKIIFMIIISHTLMAAYGILQHFNADLFMWSTNFTGRPLGTIGNPDFFAGELLISLFLTIAYMVYESKYRVLALLSVLLQLICIYYTRVAGAYLGVFAGAAIFIAVILFDKYKYVLEWFKLNKKKSAVFMAIVIILVILVTPLFVSKMGKFASEKERSLKHRLIMWQSSMLMIKEAPILGKGIGSFRLNYPYYQGILLNNSKNRDYDYVVTWMPHQNYLLIASETGLLGLGLFLLAVFIFYRESFGKNINSKLRYGRAGFVAVITALLGASFFNTFYNIAATTFIFFLILFCQEIFSGRSVGYYIIKKQNISYAIILSFAVLIYMIDMDGRTFMANMYLKKGDSFSKKDLNSQAIEYYEKVISLHPVELCPQTDVAQYYYAAESYRKSGNLLKAEEYYRQDLKLNPYCPEVNNMLGAVCGQLGKIDESIKRLELAVFVAPHYDTAYTNLTTAYASKGDFVNARRTVLKYIDRNGNKAEFENLLKAVDAAIKMKK